MLPIVKPAAGTQDRRLGESALRNISDARAFFWRQVWLNYTGRVGNSKITFRRQSTKNTAAASR